jgi:activator of HSP90 ATPase
MTQTITQKVVFKNTPVKTLYELYMDAKKHSLVTGAPAKISAKEGTTFSAHDGYIKGKNLQLVKDKLIVQSWKGQDWDKSDLDSTFIINFEQKGKDAVLHVTHANLPEKHADDIRKGWHDCYWKPWKHHLAGKKATRKEM